MGFCDSSNSFCYKTCVNNKLDKITFETMSGILRVDIVNDTYLDFPSRVAKPSSLPIEIEKSLNLQQLKSTNLEIIF